MSRVKEYLREIHSDGGRKRMPFILVVGEILLFLMDIRNILNFTMMVSPHEPTFKVVLANLFSVGFCAFSTILAVNGMMGMSSARPASWRKVVRSAFTLLFLAMYHGVLTNYGYMYYGIVFNNWVFLAMVVIVEIIMFLPSVRRYYTPPMHRTPPMIDWLKYTLVTPLFAVENYELAYPDDDKSDSGPSF